MGQRAMVQHEGELRALAAGELPAVESLTAELEALPLVIGADGVMVPFRPQPRTSKGKTRWREIKVAILARLGARLSRKANARDPALPAPVSGGVGHDRPVVAGSRAPTSVHGGASGVAGGWGGRGLWSVFQRLFQAVGAVAILDFYHAATMPRKTCTKAPAPGWMGAPAPASSGLPISVTGCGTATSGRCWRNWRPWSRPRIYPSLLGKP